MSKKRLVTERQRAESRGNVMGQGDWELYAQHRAHQTNAILQQAPAGGRAIFLGAGNCNDLDLERMAERLAELHLVDIDAHALKRAAARQSEATQAKLHLHGGVELTGLLARLSDKKRPLHTFNAIEAALQPATDDVLRQLPRDFDLAVSCCVATQLYFGLNKVVPQTDPMLVSIRHAGLVVHLRSLGHLVKPGAPVLLVNDVLSTESYPVDELAAEDGTALVQKLEDLCNQVTVFEAGNPIIIKRILRRDVGLRGFLELPQVTAAWLWTGPLARTYLVYAMRMQRAAAHSTGA
ncbi:MAG: hypothetical protein SF187_18920 [Deltaproteobacteria bacterium]|nr:hypothetical protein [Deltaproteobacteria bacterium]